MGVVGSHHDLAARDVCANMAHATGLTRAGFRYGTFQAEMTGCSCS